MVSKRSCINLVVIFLLISNVVIISAITGSIGNSRMILYPEFDGRTTTSIEKSILVKNVNDVPINITLKIAEDSDDFLELIDSEFVLGAGEEKKARFLVLIKKEGRYNGKINVFFTEAEGKGPGVVLTSSISAITKKAGETNGEDNADDNTNPENNTSIDEDGVGVNIGGAVIKDKEKKPLTMPQILIGSSLVLIIILLILLFFVLKKKSRKNKGKLNGKKRKKNR